jgi:hypothetical protein
MTLWEEEKLMQENKYFKELHESGAEALQRAHSESEVMASLESCLSECADWELWGDLLEARGRDPRVIRWAARELRFGAYLAAIGHYRNAFAQIRLFLELGISSIDFSANELSCRKWHAGNLNMKWTALIDEKSGVFSHDFCKVFFLELSGEVSTYRALLSGVYSDCSAFVHGEAETHDGDLSATGFNKELTQRWIDLRASAHLGILFGFLMRFLKELDDTEKKKIEAAIVIKFPHSDQIKDLFSNGAKG